jgi:two-component system, cell cycle response regulator
MDSGSNQAVANETLVRESKTLKLKLEEARKSKPCLVIYLGKPLGKRLLLNPKPQTIGRSSECEIPVSDGSLSKKHAQVFKKGAGQYYIKDLGSTNGTFVNDRKLLPGKAIEMKDGDFVKLGNIIFKFIAKGKIENVFHKDILTLATRDDLTGIPNRKSIMAALEEETYKAGVTKQPLSLIIFDLDNFKSVNDSFGHAAGDLVLKEAAKVAQGVIRDQDYVGRIGGDEFLVVLRNTSPANACIIGERIRSGIEKHSFGYDGKEISVTLSVGVACFDESIQSIEDFLRRADEAQYAAKKNGGNQVSTR